MVPIHPGGAPPRAGRPRDPQVAAAIEAAALDLVARHGFDAVSMERIAAEAGVGKQTIYRRWATKSDLLFDAVRHRVDAVPDPPDTGSLRGDLLARFATDSTKLYDENRAVLGVVAALPGHVDLGRRIRALTEGVTRRHARLLLDRAAAREEIAPAVEADPFPLLAVEAMIIGLTVIDAGQVDEAFVRRAVEELLLPALQRLAT